MLAAGKLVRAALLCGQWIAPSSFDYRLSSSVPQFLSSSLFISLNLSLLPPLAKEHCVEGLEDDFSIEP
jgi:hypothetical protein